MQEKYSHKYVKIIYLYILHQITDSIMCENYL